MVKSPLSACYSAADANADANANANANPNPPTSEKKTRWMTQFLNLALSKDHHHQNNNNNSESKNNNKDEPKKDEALPWGGCGPNQNQNQIQNQNQSPENDNDNTEHAPVPTSIEFDPTVTVDTHKKLSQRHSDISDSYIQNNSSPAPGPGPGASAPAPPPPSSMITPPQPIGRKKQVKNAKKIDEYGFIVNMDDKGNVRDELSVDMKGGATTPSANSNANQYHHDKSNSDDSEERKEDGGNGTGGGSGGGGGMGGKVSGLKHRLKKDKDGHHHHSSPKKSNGKSKSSTSNSNSTRSRKKLSKEEKQQKRLRRRREKKWLQMLNTWDKDFPNGIHPSKSSKSKSKHNSKDDSEPVSVSVSSPPRSSSSSSRIDSRSRSDRKPPNGPKRNKLRQRVRKGIPNSCRGEAWTRLAGLKYKIQTSHVGVYAKLVARTCEITKPNGAGIGTEEEEFNANLNVNSNYNSFNGDEALNPNPNAELNVDHAIMSETIERDLQRTFPRHSMFYDSYSEEDYDSSDEEEMGMDTMIEGDLGGSGEGVDSYDSDDASFEIDNRKLDMNVLAVDSSNSNSGSQSLLESINSQEHGNGHADGHIDEGRGEGQEGITMSYHSNEEEEDELELILNGSGSIDYAAANTKHRSNISDNLILDDAPPTPSTGTGMGDACWNAACPASPSFGKKGDAFTPTSASKSQNQNQANVNSSEGANNYDTGAKKTISTTIAQRSHKKNAKKTVDFTSAEGGQASLRRVLRAYSIYDQDVGYCQGMNFIAGMFITFVSEEEAFWLLVHIMTEAPCRMRGLFAEGMSEAHQVLYVAEQLISQFQPKLARHFEKENIHITMFATQWLLTMYTSSFPFDMVTRVWDAFLSEGWKVTYRVMLALLEQAQPIMMKMQFEDILNYFKELPFEIDSNDLMESAFKIPLKKKHIGKYAKEWMLKEELKKQEKEKEKE